MAQIVSESTIASCGQAYSGLFQLLSQIPDKVEFAGQLPTTFLVEEARRYDLWARNIAALQDARLPSSLEYRIRNDESALRIVKKTLMYLKESLDMGMLCQNESERAVLVLISTVLAISTGRKTNETWHESSSNSDSSNLVISEPGSVRNDKDIFGSSMNSEIKELGLAIQDAITNLFELSIIIRKKPEKDKYIKASLENPMDPTADIVHVGDKYTHIRTGDVWLRERLGTVITWRRQYLQYRRNHQKALEEIHELKTVNGKTVWSREKALTYQPNEVFGSRQGISTRLPQSISKPAPTEYADSSKGKDGGVDILRTPLLPKGADGIRAVYGQHFECSLCWRPQLVQSKNEWKQVLSS